MTTDSAPEPERTRYIWTRGLRIPVDKTILTPQRRALLNDDQYEHKEFLALRDLLTHDDKVVELGSGIGFLASAMSLKFGVKNIHTYEANPDLIPMIKSVLAANGAGGVTVYNKAIAAKGKTHIPFHIRDDFVASSLSDKVGGTIARSIEVETITLQDVLAEHQPSVLVMDVEGAEADIFDGADLSCLRGAVVEFHPRATGQAGINRVFQAMAAYGLGYSCAGSRGKVVTFRR